MENIFSALWKYRPQGDINPEENYFTESFKFILGVDSAFCAKFAKFVSKGRLKGPFKLESQVIYGNSIIDLQITDRHGKKLLIEIKVGARQNHEIDEDGNGSGQIEKYLRLGKGYVCFIERERESLDGKILKNKYFAGHYAWSEIYDLLNNHIQAAKAPDAAVGYFEKNFLKFMEQKDMMPFEKFTKEDAQIAPMVPDLYDRMEKFLDYIKQSKPIVDFCVRNKLDISQPYFDAYRNLAVYFSNKGQNMSGACSLLMGFEYLTVADLEDSGANEPGIYFFMEIFCARVKTAENIASNLKISPVFKERYTKSVANCEVIYKSLPFSEFAALGRQGMVKYISRSLLDLEKQGVIKEIKKYL